MHLTRFLSRFQVIFLRRKANKSLLVDVNSEGVVARYEDVYPQVIFQPVYQMRAGYVLLDKIILALLLVPYLKLFLVNYFHSDSAALVHWF